MAAGDDSTKAKLEQLEQLRDEALHAGSEKAVARQREQGKMLARERAEKLLDPGSFVELDRYVRHRNPLFGMMDRRPYGDAVVTGYGTIFDRKVFVFSQDFTIFGGSLSEAFAEKICKVMDLAAKFGCPLIGINDSGGARIQEGVVSLAGYAEIFWRNVQASGVIPQISLVMGPTAGGAVYSPAMTDFVLMVEGTSYMFITGPDVVKTVTGEEVSFEELGGAATHAAKSGVAQFISPSEEACLEDARYLLSFLPQNNLDPPPFWEASDPARPGGRRARHVDPRQPEQAVRHEGRREARRRRRRVPRGARAVRREHRLRVRAARRALRGDRRQPAQGARRGARHRLLGEGRSLRAHVRRVQHPARHVRRRTRVPAGDGAGVGRDHPPRGEAAVRVLRGDGAEAGRDHPQGLRRAPTTS